MNTPEPVSTLDSVSSSVKTEAPPPTTSKRHGGARHKVKMKVGKCANCAGTGEVRKQGQYAVRCPVCLGSRLAHQSVNRQLKAFVFGNGR